MNQAIETQTFAQTLALTLEEKLIKESHQIVSIFKAVVVVVFIFLDLR